MEISLTGRTAVVTGGSKGIGRAVATQFASSGADVAILARGKDALEEAVTAIGNAKRGRVMAVSADVSVAQDIQRAYAEIMRTFGRIDIVVNNAGSGSIMPFEKLTDDVIHQDFDQKLFAAIRLTRLVWPQMKERKWGRVINVLATGAKTPGAGTAPTTISRAAGMALTKILAGEGASFNVLVNALLVGFIETDQQAQAANKLGISLAQFMSQSMTRRPIPIGRPGRAEEFANIACFLASDASSYITGTAINVDGGLSPVV
jgi:NAD(P)-dependent dehydrogenase (short-subunit alcohol dehydrogenase family)